AQKLVGFEIGNGLYYQVRRRRESVAADDLGTERAESSFHDHPEESAAAIFEMPCFLAVPYVEDDGTQGRLFVTGRRRLFSKSDLHFLSQFSAAMATVVEYLELIDEIVLKTAEQERRLISRDIHDAAIQPYLGLRLGLEVLQRENGIT